MINRPFKDYFISEHQNIIITSRLPCSDTSVSASCFHKVTLIKNGIGIHMINGRYYHIYPRMLFFTQSTDTHSYEHTEKIDVMNIYYQNSERFSLLKDFEGIIPQQFSISHTHHYLTRNGANTLFTALEQLINSQEKGYIEQEYLFLQFLVKLRHHIYFHESPFSPEKRMLRIVRWLHLNYKEDINWQELADRNEISLRTFHRYLERDLGLAPQRYVRKLRLFSALYQLLYTSNSVTAIALESGFDNSSYFTTCFKQEFGLSPRAIRRAEWDDIDHPVQP